MSPSAARLGWAAILLNLTVFATSVLAAVLPLPLVETRPVFAAAHLPAHNHSSNPPDLALPPPTNGLPALIRHRMTRRGAIVPYTSDKLVFAHFMVGFTVSYGVGDWERGKHPHLYICLSELISYKTTDMSLAKSKSIDAFALNLGSDSWQPGQISNAYSAAQNVGFKVFLSFDMTSFPCQGAGDVNVIRQYVHDYNGHPSQLQIDGKMFVTTFAGESCTFGTGDVNQGWLNAVKNDSPATHFVPAFFVDPGAVGGYSVLDGIFSVSVQKDRF